MADPSFEDLPLLERLRLVFGPDGGLDGGPDESLAGPPGATSEAASGPSSPGMTRVPSFASCMPDATKAGGGRRDSRAGPAARRGTSQEDWALDDEGSDGVQSGVSGIAPMAGSGAGNVYVMKQPNLLSGGILKDYQLDSLQWLAGIHALSNSCRKEHGCEINAILGDEMGLGKTIQSIAILGFVKEVLKETGPHIVIVPKSTISQWSQEFAKWAPKMKVITLLGGHEARTRVMDEYLAPLYREDLEEQIQMLYPDNSDTNSYDSDGEWVGSDEPGKGPRIPLSPRSSVTGEDVGGDEEASAAEADGDQAGSDDIPGPQVAETRASPASTRSRASASRATSSRPKRKTSKRRAPRDSDYLSMESSDSSTQVPVKRPRGRPPTRKAATPAKAGAKATKAGTGTSRRSRAKKKGPATKKAAGRRSTQRRRSTVFVTESSSDADIVFAEESSSSWHEEASGTGEPPRKRAPRRSKRATNPGNSAASSVKPGRPRLRANDDEDEIPQTVGATAGDASCHASDEDEIQTEIGSAGVETPKPAFDVLLTTYEQARMERKVLRAISWNYMVLDEGHRLKAKGSKTFRTLKRFFVQHKVLLTGTPIQNNLQELWAILHFLMPKIFRTPEEFMELVRPGQAAANAAVLAADGGRRKRALLALSEEEPSQHGSPDGSEARPQTQAEAEADVEAAAQTFSVLHPILKHFLLRRNKAEVEQLPPKHEYLIRCEMTPLQRKLYKALLLKDFSVLETAVRGGSQTGLSARKIPQMSLTNILVALRKCCDHPYLFDGVEPNPHRDGEHLVRVSGKMIMLDALLQRIRARGEKVLVFCQMTMLMDILEDYLRFRGFGYYRLDGRSEVADRARAMRHFNDPRNTAGFVFLLSTRAGCLGLNLTAANNVIIVQQDFNPQADSQAVARAYRILQTKEVFVYRLLAADTVDEKIYERAKLKMQLDEMIIKRGDFSQNKSISNFLKEKNVLRGGKAGMLEIIACSGKMLDDGPAVEVNDSDQPDDEMTKNFGPIITQEGLEHILEQGLERTKQTQQRLEENASAVSSNLLRHLEEDGTLTNMKAEDLYSFEGQVYTKKRLQEIVQKMRQEKLAQAIRDGTARPDGFARDDALDWEEEQTAMRLDRYRTCHTVYAAGYQLLSPRYYELRDMVLEAIRNDYKPDSHPAGIHKGEVDAARREGEPAPRRRKKAAWPDSMSPGLTAEQARELRSLCIPSCGCFGRTKSFNGLFYRLIRYSMVAYRPWEGPKAHGVGRLRIGDGTTPDEFTVGSHAVVPTWQGLLQGTFCFDDIVLAGEQSLSIPDHQPPDSQLGTLPDIFGPEPESHSESEPAPRIRSRGRPGLCRNWPQIAFLEQRVERYKALTAHHMRVAPEVAYPYEGFARANWAPSQAILNGEEDWACVYALFLKLHQEWVRLVSSLSLQAAEDAADRAELDSDESYQDETVVRVWPGPHNNFFLADLGGISKDVPGGGALQFDVQDWYDCGDGDHLESPDSLSAESEIEGSEQDISVLEQPAAQPADPSANARSLSFRKRLSAELDRWARGERTGTPQDIRAEVEAEERAAQAEALAAALSARGNADDGESAGESESGNAEVPIGDRSYTPGGKSKKPKSEDVEYQPPTPISAPPPPPLKLRVSKDLSRALVDSWFFSGYGNDDRIERSMRICRIKLSSKEVETYGRALVERLQTRPDLVVGGKEILQAIERARACRKKYYSHVFLLRRYVDLFRYPLRDMPVPDVSEEFGPTDPMEDRLLLVYSDLFGLGHWRDIRAAMEQTPLGWGTLRPRISAEQLAERVGALLQKLPQVMQKVVADQALVESEIAAKHLQIDDQKDMWLASSWIFYPSRPNFSRPSRVDFPGMYARFSYNGDVFTGPSGSLGFEVLDPSEEIPSPSVMAKHLKPGRHAIIAKVSPEDALITHCDGKVRQPPVPGNGPEGGKAELTEPQDSTSTGAPTEAPTEVVAEPPADIHPHPVTEAEDCVPLETDAPTSETIASPQ